MDDGRAEGDHDEDRSYRTTTTTTCPTCRNDGVDGLLDRGTLIRASRREKESREESIQLMIPDALLNLFDKDCKHDRKSLQSV